MDIRLEHIKDRQARRILNGAASKRMEARDIGYLLKLIMGDPCICGVCCDCNPKPITPGVSK